MIPRVMPVLLIEDGVLVKTLRFRKPTYVGDPINVINIFNTLEVDEIVVLDIGASPRGQGPNFALLHQIAEEAMVPVAYGGGLRDVETMRELLAIGFEKVVVNTAPAEDPDLLRRAADTFGAQAVVAAIDVGEGMLGGRRCRYRHDGKTLAGTPEAVARMYREHGAGEILLTSIRQEGTMEGFDLDLIAAVSAAVDVPVIAHGGAGSLDDVVRAVKQGGASAVAAGSLFVFQGKERGILINFPGYAELKRLFSAA